MSDIRDFLQGASNAAASNVSSPIDAIAWALRKAGLDVPQNALLGSQWMAQHGLTRQPTNALAGLLGESVGGVAPIFAAAKAPQIANAMLRGGENLRAPATMNPQMGAVVYHGSPHKFDAFDSSKIGTGEGAQAYGHGLYLADSPDVAKAYLDAGGPGEMLTVTFKNGKQIYNSDLTDKHLEAIKLLEQGGQRAGQFKHNTAYYAKQMTRDPEVEALIESMKDARIGYQTHKSLYKVDLPDEKIAKMLDWDKPLSQQAEVLAYLQSNVDKLPRSVKVNVASGDKVKSSLTGADFYNRISGNPDALAAIGPRPPAGRVMQGAAGNFGRMEYDELGQRRASQLLGAQGIPGIRYLDGGSRGAGTGTSNYVVFPGEENALKILERNGMSIR